jgi:hypothetical protein
MKTDPWTIIGWGLLAAVAARFVAWPLLQIAIGLCRGALWILMDRKWHRQIKVGDRCVYESMMGFIDCEVVEIGESKCLVSYFSGGCVQKNWHEKENLMVWTPWVKTV